jgi:hypothetical protein
MVLVRTFSTASRPGLRAACGRPQARQRHDGNRGTGLTSRQEKAATSSFGGGFSIEQVLTQPLTGIEHRRTMAAADLTGLPT